MAGAIVAHAQLTGISPGANIFAARAFAPGQSAGASGTSFHILKAMDWSIREGARVINMSFAGPRDPMMTRAIQVAASRRIAMVAAMGNEGPGAPISYPAADPDVIAVTATDQAGQLFQAASRGGHVTVAAPGVDIILPAPAAATRCRRAPPSPPPMSAASRRCSSNASLTSTRRSCARSCARPRAVAPRPIRSSAPALPTLSPP